VRVYIGQNEGKAVYRCAEVVELKEYHKSYRVGNIYAKHSLVLRIGASERTMRMDIISNGSITQREYDRWVIESTKQKAAHKTPAEVSMKQKEIQEAKEYILTDVMLKVMIKVEKRNGNGPKEERVKTIEHQNSKSITRENAIINIKRSSYDRKRSSGSRKNTRRIETIRFTSCRRA
jgi:hypothetical protein